MRRPATLLPTLIAALLLASAAGFARADSPSDSSSAAIAPANPLEPGGDREWDHERSGSWPDTRDEDDLLSDSEPWRAVERRDQDFGVLFDYNRVDPLRLGFAWGLHGLDPRTPRIGARLERAFGRNRTLYGAQIEQPVVPHGAVALGASMTRRTDHKDLQQSGDLENSLTLLFSRADQRDYFEREGAGAYAVVRLPGVSAVSVHIRSDRYRSLPERDGVRSWAHQYRSLRANPAIDDGEAHTWKIRLDHPTHLRRRARAGLYHWIELERAGHGMGGDFAYTRALADIRSVVRLSPASTLSLRAVGGHTIDGDLPRQKEFTLGGPDGLRAHPVDAYVGNRVALGQAEYDVGMGWDRGRLETDLHALAFVDAGRAWNSTAGSWDAARQKFSVDGGFGIATSENALRVYFAKDLQNLSRDFTINVRLQRPF